MLILFAVWLSSLVLPALYMHFNPDGDLHPDRYSVGIWMRALKFMPLQHLPSFLFGMALGFLNEKIRPESRKRLAIGLIAFAALYLLLCVGDRLPYVMMHDGLLMPLFAGVILCLAGQIASFLRAAALHRHRRGQLLPVPAALQSLDAAARFAFSGEERPDRVRSVDFLPVADRRGALDEEAHRAAGQDLDCPPSFFRRRASIKKSRLCQLPHLLPSRLTSPKNVCRPYGARSFCYRYPGFRAAHSILG